MKESITTPVLIDEKEVILKFEHEDDIVEVYLDGKKICDMDWTENYFIVCCKAIGNWSRRQG